LDGHQVRYRYLVIADEDTVLGFRCSGVPGIAVSDREGALKALEAARNEKAGIVILTEEVAAMAREEVDAVRFRGVLPMVVEIPGARGPLPGRRSLAEVIRQAIGVKV
jgi:V/A-type H+-transporting ATPase subunit F